MRFDCPPSFFGEAGDIESIRQEGQALWPSGRRWPVWRGRGVSIATSCGKTTPSCRSRTTISSPRSWGRTLATGSMVIVISATRRTHSSIFTPLPPNSRRSPLVHRRGFSTRHPLCGVQFVMEAATFAVLGPRSRSYTTSFGVATNVITPDTRYWAGYAR